ncbi:LysM domain-containing protein [Colletotrichum camelliae]|nr:LysM domain-containing protein [Colletotrichum camelliae]
MNSFIFVRSSLQLLLAAGVVNAVRQLPAELEVDLIFPRDNETYAPTQLLPIVFGFNNLDAVWTLNIGLDVSVASIGDDFNQSRPHWKHRWVGFLSDWLDDIVGDSPPRRYLHIESVNMTNGTADSFKLLWEVKFPYRCFANNDTESRWSNGPGYASRGIFFQTADGAQRPDVEAAANSCEESDENTSAAVRIADFKKNSYDKPCPVFDTDVKPKCAFKSAAKEVAANVSAAMLRRMRCEEGEWQTITAPCPRKESKGCAAGFAVGWGLLLIVLAAANLV